MAQTDDTATPDSAIKDILEELETHVSQNLIEIKQAEEIAKLKAEVEYWKKLASETTKCVCLKNVAEIPGAKRPVMRVGPVPRKTAVVKMEADSATKITFERVLSGVKMLDLPSADPKTIIRLVDIIFPTSRANASVWVDPKMVNIVAYVRNLVSTVNENTKNRWDYDQQLATQMYNAMCFVESSISRNKHQQSHRPQMYKKILGSLWALVYSPSSAELEISMDIIRSHLGTAFNRPCET